MSRIQQINESVPLKNKAACLLGDQSFCRTPKQTKQPWLRKTPAPAGDIDCVKKDSHLVIPAKPKIEFEIADRLKKSRAKVKTYFAERKLKAAL